MSLWPRYAWIVRVSTPSLAILKPQACRSMCACTGKPSLARTLSRSTIFWKPSIEIGALRSDMNRCVDGPASRCNRRSARSSRPVRGCVAGVPALALWTCRTPVSVPGVTVVTEFQARRVGDGLSHRLCASYPVLQFEPDQGNDCRGNNKNQSKPITPWPIQLWHVLEIHSVYSGDQHGWNARNRYDSQDLHHFVLANADKCSRRILQKLHST